MKIRLAVLELLHASSVSVTCTWPAGFVWGRWAPVTKLPEVWSTNFTVMGVRKQWTRKGPRQRGNNLAQILRAASLRGCFLLNIKSPMREGLRDLSPIISLGHDLTTMKQIYDEPLSIPCWNLFSCICPGVVRWFSIIKRAERETWLQTE
jgi:hypothetical protein